MPGYVLSPEALQDLQDIWDYVALDKVLDEMRQVLITPADNLP
jgi:plasmid stabilization system protein ParE